MTTYLNNYQNSIYSTSISDFYNGVLKVGDGNFYGTGNLLYDGRSVLTAAHVFDGMNYNNLKIYLYDGEKNFTGYAKVTLYKSYDRKNLNGDLAIITFNTNFLNSYNRYDIYRDSDELYKTYTAVGYGDVGSGLNGNLDLNQIYKLKTTNTFDSDLKTLIDYSNIKLSWNPLKDSILISDFDDNTYYTDIIGYLNNKTHIGTGISEGTIASGDSGGAAFIDNKIAAIASYSTTLNKNGIGDINSRIDSSFGEIAAYQRVSYYAEFIDKTIRENLPNAPKNPNEVKKVVSEDETYAYFMLQFLPLRNSVLDTLSLNYKTVDGTAIAGSDYIETSGVISIYQDESYAIIPVELLNDNIKEDNEYFYLEVSNPNYGSLGDGVVKLTAIKLIIDDDFF